jgi:hypothetical protein
MKYTIYKDLRLSVEVEADSPQEAFDKQLDMDDNTFTVEECDYAVFDDDNDDVSDDVEMGG